MALALESANKVRQKVYHGFETNNPSAKQRLWWTAAREFFNQHVTKGNADLQFIPFSAADAMQATGVSPIGVPAKVYFLYAKNPGAGDGTDSYISLHDAADNASATVVTARIEDDGDEVCLIKPNGWVFATDLTISAATAAGGATESAEANAASGFVIVGAA